MKINLSFALMLASSSTFATVRTVSNDPVGGAQFSNFESAYQAAVNGDTLLLEGTNIPYQKCCSQGLDKSLTYIGIGFNPQKQNPRRSKIANTDGFGGFALNSGASGSKFYGIEFSADPFFYSGITWTNILFENCKFNIGMSLCNSTNCCYTVSNITYRNCIFDRDNDIAIYTGSTSNLITNINFSNCIFDGYIRTDGNPNLSMLIDHCVFLSTTTGSFSGVNNAIVMNSLFMNVFPSGITNGNFLNNISLATGTFPPAGNTGANNQNATNPNFVNYTIGQTYSTAHDYHLQSGSPAIGAASDATDIGPHGGTSKFNESGEVLIAPVMRSVLITNPTISPNGTLNVNINASKPSDN